MKKPLQGLIAQGKHYGINSEPHNGPDFAFASVAANLWAKRSSRLHIPRYLLGKKDDKVFDFIYEGLAAPLDKSLGVNEFVGLVFKCGEINIRAMELLRCWKHRNLRSPSSDKGSSWDTRKAKPYLFQDTTSSI